jgi:hypothetical protein
MLTKIKKSNQLIDLLAATAERAIKEAHAEGLQRNGNTIFNLCDIGSMADDLSEMLHELSIQMKQVYKSEEHND